MPDSYYTLMSDASGSSHTSGWQVLSGPSTEGPWRPVDQHGGPPNALAVAVAERVVEAEIGRSDLVAVRLAAEFVGPVPVAPLEVRARVLRAARSAALVQVTLTGGGRTCLTARVWFVRSADTSAIATAVIAPPPIPDADGSVGMGLGVEFGYGDSIEWRFLSGATGEPGPAQVWTRPRLTVLDGWPMSGLARAVLVADSGNGVSSELSWSQWAFANVDLDVHLLRPLDGDWVLLDARTVLGPAGSALARSTLSDIHGEVGAGMQTLVLGQIPTG